MNLRPSSLEVGKTYLYLHLAQLNSVLDVILMKYDGIDNDYIASIYSFGWDSFKLHLTSAEVESKIFTAEKLFVSYVKLFEPSGE